LAAEPIVSLLRVNVSDTDEPELPEGLPLFDEPEVPDMPAFDEADPPVPRRVSPPVEVPEPPNGGVSDRALPCSMFFPLCVSLVRSTQRTAGKAANRLTGWYDFSLVMPEQRQKDDDRNWNS
jgi:hypothetical protein